MGEDKRGHYYGRGMTVTSRNKKIVILSPLTGSPAFKAGLRPGDVIITVNDKPTDNLTTSEAAELLKGPRGTPVQTVISSEGHDQPMTFNLLRDEIPHTSIQSAAWLSPGIAYMHVQSS